MPALTNEDLTLAVAAAGVLISIVAAGIALFQLRAGVRQGRHQATFEHLGRVRALLREISHIDPAEARAAALAYWTHQADELPPAARSYRALLDEWDLLGVAYREKQVDRKIVLRALRYTLRNPHNVSRGFIDQVQAIYQNPGMYADLDYLIVRCARPTPRERVAALLGRVGGGATASQPAPVAKADPGAENAGAPSVQAIAPPPETTAGERGSPAQREDDMTDPKPAAPPPPPPPPPLPRKRVERGETPAFRPPPPKPPTERK